MSEARPDAAEQPIPAGNSAVEQRLAELGRVLPLAPAPVAAYLPALISGNQVFTSGQLPSVDGKLTASGKVGAEVAAADAKEQAAICAINALAAVKSVIGDLDRITRVVKVVGFVASDPSFTDQPEVINGASELLGAALGEAGTHARSAVGVSVLPRNAPVEVELVVEFQ